MRFPAETAVALMPPCRKAGGVTLRPLTIAGAVEIDRRGIDLARGIPADRVAEVAAILAGDSSENGRGQRLPIGLEGGLSTAVERVLNDAFETYLKPQPDPHRVPGPPTGLGWPLEIAEFLCGEYGWTIDEALNCPVATAFALIAANRQRHGARHGEPDYTERAYIKEWKRKKHG